jgi:hypothetical protein
VIHVEPVESLLEGNVQEVDNLATSALLAGRWADERGGGSHEAEVRVDELPGVLRTSVPPCQVR